MPLVKNASKSALRRNIAAEVRSGRPQKQAAAIAHAVQRAAKGKPKVGGDMKYTQPMPTPKPKKPIGNMMGRATTKKKGF